jgi:rhamnosyltransferase
MPDPIAGTAAVLVVYRSIDGLEPTLQALRHTVAQVVVVDNHPQGHAKLPALAAKHGATAIAAHNQGGLAGGYNRALRWLRAARPDGAAAEALQWVVFVDEDSDTQTLRGVLTDPRVQQRLREPGTAAVSPAYRDRATGLRGKYMELQRTGWHYSPREFSDQRAVAFVINSMSIWRADALRDIGAFNEGLAVDHVDTEYCLRARALGRAVYVDGAHEFLHAIGQRKVYRLLGRELQAGGHSPERRHMIARNTVWLARQWLLREPAFAALCLARLAYEAAGIVIAEDRAAAKLWALTRGALRGLFTAFPKPVLGQAST